MKNNRISSIAHSKLFRRGLLAIFFLACVVLLSFSGSRVSSQTSTPTPPPQARNETKPVAQLLSEAKRAGRNFPLAEPFNPQTRSAAATAPRRGVRAGTVLQLRQNALADLVNRKEQSLTLRLPTFGGPPVELELVQVNLFAPNFHVTTSESPDTPVAVDTGVHYWGAIKGAEDSLAAISIFKDEVIGFYSSDNSNFVIGKLGGNNPRRDHILYAEKDLLGTIPVDCDMPDDGALPPPGDDDPPPPEEAAARCIKVYIEADFDLFQNKGSVDATINYMTGVFNQSAALYNNEGVPISISQIFVWNTTSPYNGASSNVQLTQFQATRTSFNGDIAHLVDIQPQGGIAAGFNGLCNSNRSQSECYSGIDPFFQNVPTYSWTVYVFTHEMGHLFGSRHTHACVWNGNNTAIDSCAGFTEEGCPLPGIPSGGGTIMSYCHLQSTGINFTKGFGPQPGNVIRNRFNTVSCLGTCGGPTVSFSSANYSVNESNGLVTITVNRSGTTLPPATVDYTTMDGSAQQTGDYTIALGTLSFGTNETSKTFQVLITDDGHVEGNETVTLMLSNPTGGLTLGAPSSAVLTISSNDSTASQPIDGAQFFVRQHYRDFLNREPDTDGLNFWTNEITSCGSNAQCI